jgi:repressor of nif and glnA expression
MLEGLTPPVRLRTCGVRSVLETLEPEDQEILRMALADDDSWGAKTLERALRDRGVSLGQGTITHHRRLLCSCFR